MKISVLYGISLFWLFFFKFSAATKSHEFLSISSKISATFPQSFSFLSLNFQFLFRCSLSNFYFCVQHKTFLCSRNIIKICISTVAWLRTRCKAHHEIKMFYCNIISHRSRLWNEEKIFRGSCSFIFAISIISNTQNLADDRRRRDVNKIKNK